MTSSKKNETQTVIASSVPEIDASYYEQEYQNQLKRDQQRREEEAQQQAKLFDQLNEPFPAEMERTLTKGGTRLTYLPVSEVITRLNRIFGPLNWSSEIIRCERDTLDPDFIVAHVRITTSNGNGWSTVTKDGFGGQKIKRTKAGDIVDLGDEFKGAVSDALKKAAQQFGVGLYLSRDPDAIEIDDAMHASVSTPQPTAPVVQEGYEKFMSLRSQLDEEQVKELRSYWNNFSKGRPVPKAHEFTANELEVLIIECTRLLFGGEYTLPQEEEHNDE